MIFNHSFEWKPGAEYSIEVYGSELAGNVLNCNICGASLLQHRNSEEFKEAASCGGIVEG